MKNVVKAMSNTYLKEELIIPLDKYTLEHSTRSFIYLIALLVLMLFYLRRSLWFYPLAALLALLLLSLDHIYAQIKSDKPAVLVNQDGIWTYNYGFVSWTTVSTITMQTVFSTPIEYVGIKVKSRFNLFKQAPLSGKVGIFWSVLFGYAPVLIYAKQEELKAILDIAERYHKA